MATNPRDFWLAPYDCFRRGYALTMVDSLDMHAVVGDGKAFRQATRTLLRDFESGTLSFDRNVEVSVFEASIRVLGGLVRKTSAQVFLTV